MLATMMLNHLQNQLPLHHDFAGQMYVTLEIKNILVGTDIVSYNVTVAVRKQTVTLRNFAQAETQPTHIWKMPSLNFNLGTN
jgi:hypothetical protein